MESKTIIINETLKFKYQYINIEEQEHVLYLWLPLSATDIIPHIDKMTSIQVNCLDGKVYQKSKIQNIQCLIADKEIYGYVEDGIVIVMY